MERRNGALDVLRALAITTVVGCHIYATFGEPTGEGRRLAGLGGRGVDLFFLLSGWLLGHQLLTERKRTGTVDVPRFWLRRAFRTLPAYYAVLAFTVAQAALKVGRDAVDPAYLVFLQNYLPTMPYFGVTWSLCVEEHFYLVVGPALLLMNRSRLAGPVVCALLAVPTVCRVMGWYRSEFLFDTHVRYDQCATGVVLAWVCVERPGWWQGLCRVTPVIAAAGLAGAGWVVFVGQIGWPVAYEELDLAFWTLVFASWVLLANAGPGVGRAADFRGTRFLANRAYALYLLHMDAIGVVKRLGDLPLAVRFALVWAVGLLAAEVLYRLVERPGMRAREWFAVTRSPRREAGEVGPRRPTPPPSS